MLSSLEASAQATRLAVVWLCLLHHSTTSASAQTLPYVPTTVLVPETDRDPLQYNASNDIAYIFSPNGHGSVALLALNYSSAVQASDLPLQTLTPALPFPAGDGTAFAPVLTANGSLVVYAGNCSTANQSSIWTFNPLADGSGGTWTQETTFSSSSGEPGPGFLGGSLSFSTTLAPEISPANIYVYGGMCPSTASSAALDAQSNATYSDQMVRLSTSSSEYNIETMSSKNAPIPEAGFSFSALVPSLLNHSGLVTQQINHVVLGGHTQTAFVNMSTAAIWSLPEEDWAYVDISTADSETVNTELTVKSTSGPVNARSGHTAVLNEDGTALIVYGGWVENVSVAATPQLAVLEIGAGFGGDGTWHWEIPETQPEGGVYGHGAALLPGNVMVVYGGFSMSASDSNAKRRREAASSNNNVPKFLNLTDMSWSSSYNNPAYFTGGGASSQSQDSGLSPKQHLGLGLGLGLGLAAVLAALMTLFLYRRRLRRRRAAREDAIRAMAQDNNQFFGHEEMFEQDNGRGFQWYMGSHDQHNDARPPMDYVSLRTGQDGTEGNENRFGDSPLMQIARKPIADRTARGQYQPAPTAEYEARAGNIGGRRGGIHPIYEADEDGEAQSRRPPDLVIPARDGDAHRDSAPSDLLLTPTNERPAPITPSGAEPDQRNPDVQDWMTNIDAADALLASRRATHSSGGAGHGKTSPTRGKTSPTRRATIMSYRPSYQAGDDTILGRRLSGSKRSIFSRSNSHSGVSRGSATIAETALAAAAEEAAEAAAVAEAAVDEGRGSSSSSSAPSYSTAKSHSSFQVLRASGPGLLMGGRSAADHEHQHDHAPDDEDVDETPGSPSKSKPLRRSWLGSLRRVFSGPTPSPSPPESERGGGSGLGLHGDSTAAEGASGYYYDPRLGGLDRIAAGGLFKRKSGRRAWEAEDADRPVTPPSGGGRRADNRVSGRGVLGEIEDEDEWDIERAVERRLVQVLFTTPKGRLRVVNAEPSVESLHDVVVVDPDREEGLGAEGQGEGEAAGPERLSVDLEHREASVVDDDVGEKPQRAEISDEGYIDKGKDKGKGKQTQATTMATGSDSGLVSELQASATTRTATLDERPTSMQSSHRHLLGMNDDDDDDRRALARLSSGAASEASSVGRVLSAEAVRLERPRTTRRVLEMVERLEGGPA